jgi:transposase
LTTKRGSTTAHQALEPHNILRRELYWTQPPPIGVAGVNIFELADFDECAIFLQTVNRNRGKAYTGVRVREAGPYGHDKKMNLLMCIGPNNFLHLHLHTESGTTATKFATFVGEGRKTYLWDNLSSHHSDIVLVTAMMAGHRVVARPPYCPFHGPIEFIFNQLEHELQLRLHSIRTNTDLIAAIHDIVGNLAASFHRTFIHCGY